MYNQNMFWDHFISKYLLALIVFLGIDAVWLGLLAKNLYQKYLGSLLAENPKILPAAIFYIIYPIGVVIFAVNPALRENSFVKSILYGALLGFLAYSTYDLTNAATLKNWPAQITVVDIVWGTVLTAVVSAITYLIIK